MKATRHLFNLNQATIRLGARYPSQVERLAELRPDILPTETVNGHRYFNPGDIDALAERVKAGELCVLGDGHE